MSFKNERVSANNVKSGGRGERRRSLGHPRNRVLLGLAIGASTCLLTVSSRAASAAETIVIPPIIDAAAMKDGKESRAYVDACENFYEFACGAWIDNTVIPADKSAVSRQVTAATDSTDVVLNKILEAYSRGDFSIPSTYATKLSDYYNSCMQADQQTEGERAAIAKQIQKIYKTTARANDRHEFAKLLANLNNLGANAFFGFGSNQDPSDSSRVIGDVVQGGLALDSRDYYLNADAKSVETRAKYKDYIVKLFALSGMKAAQAEKKAAGVLAFEIGLAQGAYSIADRDNPLKTTHVANQAQLAKLAPALDWQTYFTSIGLKNLNSFNIDEPEFLTNASKLLLKTAKSELADYLVWRLLDTSASHMGGEFEKAHFEFWDSYIGGAKEMLPRWKLCTQDVESHFGYALAEAYVKTFDGAAIKAKTEGMIKEIKQSFVEDLHGLNKGSSAWIDDATLQGALDKVAAVDQKVGAPNKFRDYDSVKTTPSSFLENYLRLNQFESKRDFMKIGKPVDKTEWSMMPWEVNAYYNRSNNEFVFPFGILQPPSLDSSASDGANYGAFGGGTIGHELTHGFDKNGSKYDLHGNLKNWWSDQTNRQFDLRAQCYIDQANAYRIEEVGLSVNGAQTIDENLADQGGVRLGYLTLDRILRARAEGASWHGYSERQQYWIGYAQSWCNKSTPERLRKQMITNEHPPSEFRVNAVMMNRPEFARDFNCKAGSKMAPVQRCSIW